MPKLVELNDDNFSEIVIKSDKPVLVDFSASWCGPCKKLTPVIEKIAEEYEGRAVICHLDVDNAQESANKYQIMTVPTCIYFKDGEPVETMVGLVPRQLITEKLDELL